MRRALFSRRKVQRRVIIDAALLHIRAEIEEKLSISIFSARCGI